NRKRIVARKRGYRGVSMSATSATGISEVWNMTDLSPDFIHINPTSSNEFREVIQKEGAETIAAFIAEPMSGAGGIILAPQNYFKEIREICDEYGSIFIADEVITGFGRTGKMFGLQNWNVVPDIMTVANGISSGYVPLGGVVISDKIYKEIKYNTKGTLFHG